MAHRDPEEMPHQRSSALRSYARIALALALATVIWIPLLQFIFRPAPESFFTEGSLSPRASAMVSRHLRLWKEPELRRRELKKMRGTNAEWDFMGRSFLVWSLAEIATRAPKNEAKYLKVMDRIIEETIALEEKEGIYHFLLPYARHKPFKDESGRSIFIDGEIALMIGLRRLVEERRSYESELSKRVEYLSEQMSRGPVLSGESYPDECWMFCNVCALAAIRVADHLDETDHSAFIRRWVKTAKAKLTDPISGMLVSSFTHDGRHLDGPEGSSIWFVSHMLRIVDPAFARDQYERARQALAVDILGFAYAKEWPQHWRGRQDVDSGPIIPIVDASAGSSGLAFVAASSFRDKTFLGKLATSLDFAGFPLWENGELRYGASNQVGDAVMLYATVLGPLWKRVEKGGVK